MNRGNDISRGNPVPGFPQTPSAPQERAAIRPVPQSHEFSRPRRPQR